ncbi:MAG: hypothetical protein IIV41_11340 [Akkermansia sp.]|nr:hypothetical protein [Akkermansia sp.]
MESAVPSEFCFYLLAAAEVKPWALGVFIVLFGLGGLAFLVCSGRDKADREDSCAPELAEGALVLCALMVVTPPLLLLPEELRQEIPVEALLIAALVAAVIISFGIRALLRWLGARPRKPQRQGRPSLPGLGKRGRKRRKSKGNVGNGR